MADRTGQHLGNYRILRPLGQGGFAEVYLGEHRYLKSYAALKVLRVSLTGEDAQRFLAEAQTLVRLTHPNIVRVLDFGIERGTPVLVMDYAPGGTTRQRHPRGSRLSLSTTVDYINQVSAALQYAHNHNVIHRDVKPDNILIGLEQQALLSDFGLALLAPSPEDLSAGEMAGTLPYVAPEQLRGRPSFASDQYSLGIVAYEWLCGMRPFDGTYWELVHKHLSSAPPPLRESSPELPAEVEAVVLRALAKDPQQRFPSIQHFARAFANASQRQVIDDDSEVTAPLRVIAHPELLPSPVQSPAGIRTLQKVFLSVAPADAALAERLKTDLGKRGVLLSNDPSSQSTQELDQENAVRQAIREAGLALVIVTPQTRASRTVKEHMRIAAMYQRPILFIWAAGENIAPLLLDAWGATTQIEVIDARGARYETALDEIIDSIREESYTPTPRSFSDTSLPTLQGEPRNPYKGLRPFRQDDADDFFGRDTLIEDLTKTLNEVLTPVRFKTAGGRLLAVIGPSGSGKSSVIMAGLLPRLQQGALEGSERWIYLNPIVPGARPLEELALAFMPHMPERSLRSIREDLADDSARGLHLLATHLIKRTGQRVILTIDQFEEIFTQTVREQERQHIIDLLVTAATEPRGPVLVLLTLRADFYDRPMSYPELNRLIEARHASVLPMDLQNLRAIIEEPALLPDVQLIFEGNLVGDLLFETQGQAGALPLLEFTLDQLFQQRQGNWLTIEAYQQIGGVKGALAKHAEATYTALLTIEHRQMARALFLRLIDPGRSEQDTTRRRAAMRELTLPDPAQTAVMNAVADAFVAARLLTTSEFEGEQTIEVSHEALIREWPRLSTWLQEAREDITLQRAISADANDWLKRGQPEDRLYHGTRLSEAQAWAGRNAVSSDEAAFLQASVREHERQEQTELHRQAREIALQRRVVNRQRLLMIALSIFLVVALVLASLAELSYQNADYQRHQAELATIKADARALAANASSALAQGRLDQALLLSIKATQIDPGTYEARDSLLSSLQYSPHLLSMLQSGAPLNQIAFRPDGQTLVAAGSLATEGDISFWNVHTKTEHTVHLDFRGRNAAIPNWAISPDAKIVAGANDHGLWLWDSATGTQLARLEAGGQLQDFSALDITPIAFSPDGSLLASARCAQYSTTNHCTQGQLLLWNMTKPQPDSRLIFNGPARITHLAFSPDGRLLVASVETLGTANPTNSIQIWDVSTATLLSSSFAGFTGGVAAFAFSPDGSTLAASDGASSIYLWNVASQKSLPGTPFNAKGVQCLAFSSDGKLLASGSTDKTVQVWNISTAQPTGSQLLGHQGIVTSVAFSPDGQMLTSGDDTGMLLLWNMGAGSSLQHEISYDSQLFSAAYSPDGRTLATGDGNGKITLRAATTGNILATLDATQAPTPGVSNPLAIQSLAFSPDRPVLVAGRSDGMIFLWNALTRQPLGHFRDKTGLTALAISSDAQILAASYANGSILLWNAATGRVMHQLTHPSANSTTSFNIALSQDGKTLAYGNTTGVVLWNVTTGKPIGQPLTGHLIDVQGVAFSPAGHTLASIDSTGTIMLWDIGTMKARGQPFVNVDPGALVPGQTGLAFSPDGSKLAVGATQSAAIWDIAQTPPQRIAHPFQPEGATLLAAQVRGIAFSPQGQQILTISDTYTQNFLATQWDVNIGSWQNDACNIAHRNFTLDEWKQFVAGAPYQKVCSDLPVDSSVVQDELSQAHAQVQAGHAHEAEALYRQATQESAQLDDAFLANNVCAWGSLDQFAQAVLPACNEAVALDPHNGQYYDSRGVARALQGDRQGAIADFKFFVNWANDDYMKNTEALTAERTRYSSLIAERSSWIQQLQAGRNPFSAKLLQALRIESGIDR